MSGNGAFEDEMDILRRKSQHPDDELSAFAQAVRTTLLEPPDPATGAALVARLAGVARESASPPPVAEPSVGRRPRFALAARVAVAVASIPFLFAGLAYAGVDLPGPADSAFEKVGIELPNQAADDDQEGTSKDGDSAGSATGQENSSGKLGHGKSKSNPARDGDRGHGKQGKALGKQGLAPGQSKPKGQSGGGGSQGTTPPGQAKKDTAPGNSGSSPGNAKGHSK